MSTEITVQVFNSPQEIRQKFLNNGWTVKETYTLNDWYYSRYTLKQLKNISYEKLIKNSFLVRQVLILTKNKAELCYKLKKFNNSGNLLFEQKVTAPIKDLNPTLQILKLAGLTNWCEVHNNTTALTNGKIELLIQEIAGLGTFIEFEESKNMQKLDSASKFNILVKTLKEQIKNLNLNLGNDYSCKKAKMLLEKSLQTNWGQNE